MATSSGISIHDHAQPASTATPWEMRFLLFFRASLSKKASGRQDHVSTLRPNSSTRPVGFQTVGGLFSTHASASSLDAVMRRSSPRGSAVDPLAAAWTRLENNRAVDGKSSTVTPSDE